TWNPVERAAQEGDAVELETFSTVDGERLPPEGAERGATVVGSAAMFPAIEAALVGMKAGEEKTVEVEFPASWRVPQFARSEEHTSELQSRENLVCRLLLEKNIDPSS